MNLKVDKDLEKKLWAAADALRGNISSEEYMYIVVGILFLKHMSDKYDYAIEQLEKDYGEKYKNHINDKDYLQKYGCSFFIPEKAKWDYIKKNATSNYIGKIIDEAFSLIENSNHELRGLFDKNYNREELDQNKLGQVVSEFSNLDFDQLGEDVFGRVYEYFLGQFFLKQGQKGGEFYTPKSIVELIVDLVNPNKGKIYDPTAGTGGMLVQAREAVKKSGKEPDELVAYGQEYQNKTWKLSKINLLLHGYKINNIRLGAKSADTFTDDQHRGEKFDYIMANPPFNLKNWGYENLLEDPRWEWGTPPKNNANYAFISHMLYKLSNNGRGATVLANGSLSCSRKDEIDIRKKFIESNYIDAIISLPDKLFYTTGIPVCIWVFNKNKKNRNILMIEAKNLEGNMLSKKLRELTKEDIKSISSTYKKHLEGKDVEEIGFAKTISQKDLKEQDWSFVPGRYVGIKDDEVDVELTKEQIKELSKELDNLFDEFEKLIPKVKESIKKGIK